MRDNVQTLAATEPWRWSLPVGSPDLNGELEKELKSSERVRRVCMDECMCYCTCVCACVCMCVLFNKGCMCSCVCHLMRVALRPR
jgi:hypothetical protein